MRQVHVLKLKTVHELKQLNKENNHCRYKHRLGSSPLQEKIKGRVFQFKRTVTYQNDFKISKFTER